MRRRQSASFGAGIVVRRLRASDLSEWRRLRRALWPRHAESELRREEHWYRSSRLAAVFVAARPDGGLGGFVEATAFRRVDWWNEKPEGYVEGWYVDSDLRRRGIGRGLIAAVEEWCRRRGLEWIGSDAHRTNLGSRRAHRALGFREVEELVLFRKRLRPRARLGC